MASVAKTCREEIVEEPVVYVAVGKDFKESKFTLLWALENSEGKNICIIHVHKPSKLIPGPFGKLPPASSLLAEQEVRAYRNNERRNLHEILDMYLLICRRKGVHAEKLYIETDCIEKGLVELISMHGIRELVMGAAANKHYKNKMKNLKSKKAIYVSLQAPASCRIQFICKGHLIYTRKGSLDGADVEVTNSKLKSNHSRSPIILCSSNINKFIGRITDVSSQDGAWSRLDAGESCEPRLGFQQVLLRIEIIQRSKFIW